MEKAKSPVSLSKAFLDACTEISLAAKRHGTGLKGIEYFLANGTLHSEVHVVSGRMLLIGTVNLGSLHPQEEAVQAQSLRRTGLPEDAPRFLSQMLTAVSHLLDLNQDPAVQTAIQAVEHAVF